MNHFFVGILGLLMAGGGQAAEVFEVSRDRAGELPGGKEADGIIGDFVLRSDAVEAVVSHNAPLRRANMGTFYGNGGQTPGCLYDLTIRGANNDQITILAPLGQRGDVSYVRIVPAPEVAANEAAVDTVITAAKNGGLYERYRYLVTDGVQGVTVHITLRNEGSEPVTVKMNDTWTGLARANYAKGFLWGDAVDPADKAGYALTWVKTHGVEKTPKGEETIAPGETLTATRFLAVGTSPLQAVGIAAARREQTHPCKVMVRDASGAPVTTCGLSLELAEDKEVVGYPDETGTLSLRLPAGSYPFRLSDQGRETVTATLEVGEGKDSTHTLTMGPQSAIVFRITDEAERSIPCKAQFEGLDGTPTPNLGPDNRAHGCRDQWHAESGQFRVAVAPGKYRVTVTRGIEYSHLRLEVEVPAGGEYVINGVLRRLVDTSGWVSTDFHNHSTPSGDNTCGTNDRLINLAAEHIEFAPTTEHNRIYDWAPHIASLGLEQELSTVPGMELTGSGGHLNSFPLRPVPKTQDWGAPVWDPDARVNALHLREHQGGDPDRWVHLNHPRMEVEFFDKDGDGLEDGGFVYLGGMLDGLETENFVTRFQYGDGILGKSPYRIQGEPESFTPKVSMVREVIWLQLLNRGQRIWAIAVADAHTVWGNGVGGWRTYIPCSTDAPGEIDWREMSRNAKKGQMVLTTGPFLQVSAGEGVLPGGTLAAPSRKVPVQVKVQCTDWIDIDRVQVLVNGRQREDLNFTRQSHPQFFSDGVVKFDQTLEVLLTEDSHLIVVAMGEGFDLKTGFGSSAQSAMNPCAYHNPIFVDVDGNGFQPNGDMLGFPAPAQGMSVDRVRAILEKAGH